MIIFYFLFNRVIIYIIELALNVYICLANYQLNTSATPEQIILWSIGKSKLYRSESNLYVHDFSVRGQTMQYIIINRSAFHVKAIKLSVDLGKVNK